MELTFGEQVKVVLKRKGMTIKQLAEIIEDETGKKMSRQNLTQRLGRDNFQEQDMRMIASILGCPFHLSIMDEARKQEELPGRQETENAEPVVKSGSTRESRNTSSTVTQHTERDITVGELIDINEELDTMLEEREQEDQNEVLSVEELLEEVEALEAENARPTRIYREAPQEKVPGWKSYLQRKIRRGDPESKAAVTKEEIPPNHEPAEAPYEEIRIDNIEEGFENDLVEMQGYAQVEIEPQGSPKPGQENNVSRGEINPYTGQEYKSNSVRVHPKRIGYVQVYDREEHKWTDMTEWAFLGYQERKKALLGKDYEPPIYLD